MMQLLLAVVLLFAATSAQKPCHQVNTISGSYCKCNAQYCDTVPELVPLTPGDYQLYTTSKKQLGFWTSTGKFSNESQHADVQVTVDLSRTRQTILGFGGAFTDATGINIASLSEAAQELLLQAYFGAEGVQYSVGRVPIGGTDFSLKGYTYCDVEDESLEAFALQREDYEYKIRYVQRALDIRGKDNVKLFASAWSAPVWMKNTDKYNGFGKIQPKYYGLWAEYYIKFFEAYEEQNVTFWGVTTQNEPVDGIIGTRVQSNGFDSAAMKKWIKEALGPKIRNSKYSDLKIILHDDQRLLLPLLKRLVLSDNEVVQYADGVGVHFYSDFIIPGWFLNFASVETKPLFRLATEACAGSAHMVGLQKAVDLGSWARAESYLTSLFSDLLYDVIGWVDWNMALNTSGGPNWISNEVDSPVIVNSTSDEFYKQPMFYAVGHFSKFIVPSSVRVESTLVSGSGVKCLSFLRPDGRVALVLWNKSSRAKTVTISLENLSGTIALEGHSINTLLLGV